MNFMKILFITDLYPIKHNEKNTPLTLHNFVFEWLKQGHDVTVIKPNWIFNSFIRGKAFYLSGFYEYEGVKIFNVNYFMPFLFNISDKIPKEINDYDIVVAHMPSGIIFANKLIKMKKLSASFICAVHCSDIEVLKNPIYQIYFKRQLINAYKNAKKIACRSYVLQKKFNEILPELAQKTFVAPSGVSFTGDFLPYKTHHLPLTILTCANLIKRKNIDKLILAVNNLEGFELKIIGDGSQLSILKKIAASNVKFLGRLTRDKVLEKMKESDIFMLPSVNETFGMVYLEAMASGCITVCTQNDGIDGIIQDSVNGFLIEPKVVGIKETLLRIKMFENKNKIVENAFKTIKDYTQEACAENYLTNLQ